ncbi:recombinase family protein [Streptosporangium amethystogenes]|uniref:recombinase family protein n=1 Tax=Streptosporangium amethystogenes TaxID=2002 RepID=UPI0037ACC274
MTSQRSIGYARIHDEPGDFRDQVAGLAELGVRAEEMFWDRCASARDGLIGAVRRCERGDTLTVTALDRLATSLEDLEDLTPMLIDREIRLNVGGVVFDPVNEVGRSVFDTFRTASDVSEPSGLGLSLLPVRMRVVAALIWQGNEK